jgi:protein-tyrosine phosphatase
MNYPYAHEIVPRVWIGDRTSSQDKTFISQAKINVIVNCTRDLPNFFEPVSLIPLPAEIVDSYFVKYYRVACEDNGRPEELEAFLNGTKLIIDAVLEEYNKGKNILIHCAAGQQRSCAFAICLFKRLGADLNTAFQTILSKRQMAFGFGRQINFKKSIELFI